MKISNLSSPRGNVVPNQFEIETSTAVYFKSYDSIIAKIQNGITYLDETYWNWSKTTSKYRNIFLGENTNETKVKIDNGTYIMTDLNAQGITDNQEDRIIDFKFFKRN